MRTLKRTRRAVALVLVGTIALLCAGLLADSGHDGEAAEIEPAQLKAATPLSDSMINLINADYRAIEPILRSSCYDCHSTYTDYPWYHSLPVVGGFMDDHIKEGREHLDFTDGFPFRSEHDQLELLGDIRKEIEEGEMPLLSYRLLHWGTLIGGAQRDSVFTWIDQTIARLQSAADTAQ